MRLTSLEITNLRNLGSVALRPGPRFTVIHGDNAQGKTNLLEAIYLVAFLRSYRTRRLRELIAWGQQEARVAATVEEGGIESCAILRLKGGERVVEVDGKRVRSPVSYVGLLRTVLFGPDDLDLTKGGPDARRRYLDRILFLSDPGYWALLRGYSDALRSRNRLLQESTTDDRVLASFEAPLAEHAVGILARRRRLVERLQGSVGEILGRVARWHDAGLGLRYKSSVPEEAWTREGYRELMVRARLRDARRGFTSVGPHTDDLDLTLGRARPFRAYASQGQHRLLAITLKIAEMEILKRLTGSDPVLLLDDVSSELDRGHYELFKAYLAGTAGQVFVTTTDREVLPPGPDIHYYRVQAGRVEAEAPTDGA